MSDRAPVGSIAAFGGMLSSCRVPLHEAGWLLCDGTSYDGSTAPYDTLFAIIKNQFGGSGTLFNVPDLRGQFLRGVNRDAQPPVDPDVNARQPQAAGGKSNNVGSTQSWATKSPTAPFTSDTYAGHSHNVPNVPNNSWTNTDAGPAGHNICAWNSDATNTDQNNGHTHTLSTGGDAETRPDNLYLHWFIKFQ